MTATAAAVPTEPRQLRQCGIAIVREVLVYPEPMTVSEWADQYRYLSKEVTPEPGPWRTSRVPYLRGIMDAISDPLVEIVVFKKCARIGGTEAGMNMIGYFVHHDPSPILTMQPTVENAEDWSKEQLAPMISETPVLRKLIREPRGRDSGNTILHKAFAGGYIRAVGANSPSGLRRRNIRILFLDEVDGFGESAGTEGDPVDLALNRTINFANRKIFMASTPGDEGFSRIEPAYEESDQRLFDVPCPHCGHMQPLEWKRLRYKDRTEPVYVCAGCEQPIAEKHKRQMNLAGEWVARGSFQGTAGFHINQLYSEFDGASWPKMVDAWIKAQNDAERLKVFVNTRLAEVSTEGLGAASIEALESRLEEYDTVPAGAVVLTAGIDVQADRLEILVRGWGRGEESWLVEFLQIPGDVTQEAVWLQFDQFRRQQWAHELGVEMPLAAVAVDSGKWTDQVYRYCAPRLGSRVFAIKGASKAQAPLVNYKPTVQNHRCRLWMVGTNDAKDSIEKRLKLDPVGQGPMPGAYHFPAWSRERYGEYFVQLTAEKKKRRMENGRWRRRWILPKGKRCEAWDCEVYALAALRLARVDLDVAAKALEERGEVWGKARAQRARTGRRQRSKGVE